jgi:alanine racemase
MIQSRNWAEVDVSALRRNIHTLQHRYSQGCQIMAVVKADAYGHGIHTIVPVCISEGILGFGVAAVAEAAEVRNITGDSANIYLLTAVVTEEIPAILDLNVIPIVSDVAFALDLAKEAHQRNLIARIHLEVDTGIGRAGFSTLELPDVLRYLDEIGGIHVSGLMTHFASADEDPADAALQDMLFSEVLDRIGPGARDLELHTDNSPGALLRNDANRRNGHWLIRPGLLLYGTEPAPGMFTQGSDNFEPVLALKARVTLSRQLREGSSISYGRTYRVPDSGRVYATIPVGYGDGYPRALSNCGWVLLHGQRAPICGRVCMDQFVVDVSDIPDVRVGDTAVLLGRDGDARVTAGELAAVAGLTPHELTTCLTARVPRIAID